MKGKETAEEEKFRDLLCLCRSHTHHPPRIAPPRACFRGQSLDVLKIELGLGEEIEAAAVPHPCVAMIAAHFRHRRPRAVAPTSGWPRSAIGPGAGKSAFAYISTELLAQFARSGGSRGD